MTQILIDALLICALLGAVVYAWRISGSMQKVKEEMKPVTRQLGSYLNTIGQHISQLKETTETNRHVLSDQIPKAKVLRDDFEVLLEHGNKLASRLDTLLEQAYAVERTLRGAHTSSSTHNPSYKPISGSPSTSIIETPFQTPSAPPPYSEDPNSHVRDQIAQTRNDMMRQLRGIRV